MASRFPTILPIEPQSFFNQDAILGRRDKARRANVEVYDTFSSQLMNFTHKHSFSRCPRAHLLVSRPIRFRCRVAIFDAKYLPIQHNVQQPLPLRGEGFSATKLSRWRYDILYIVYSKTVLLLECTVMLESLFTFTW